MNTEGNSNENQLENGTAPEGQIDGNGSAYKGDPEQAAGTPTGDASESGTESPASLKEAIKQAFGPPQVYLDWQKKHEALLMDGTYSQATYIRLAESEDVEYGIQLRVSPCPDHIHVGYRARAAYKVPAMEDPDQPRDHAEKQDEHERLDKVDGLTAFFNGTPDWEKVDVSRVSLVDNFIINVKPLSDDPEGELAKFKAIVRSHLTDLLLARIPTPVGGFQSDAVHAFNEALVEYVAMTADQFKFFRKVTFAMWESTETASTLPEELVASLEAIKNPAQGGADSNEQAE